MIFHHPAVLDERGKPKRVRRGLGTSDSAKADELVAQVNELLTGIEWHSPAARERAMRQFDERAVRIFFESMEGEAPDGWALRGEVLPLPGAEQGYARVLLAGATGAGKTTFVRQIIGTDPDRERFPSTSTAKTTVADTEIILAQGTYKAVVTFFSRDKIRAYIEECVVAAVGATAEGAEDRRVASLLLEHREQRFRLSYMLGSLATATTDDDWEDAGDEPVGSDEVTDAEREALQARLRELLDACKQLGREAREKLAAHFSVDAGRLEGADRDAFLMLLEEHVLPAEECQQLVDRILDDVESRFDLLSDGVLERSRSGWPLRWTFEVDDREAFLPKVNRLSSNYAGNFGKLLTPIVQGVRVQGPFAPIWSGGEMPRLVLLDGEGLGHTSDSAQSLPTHVTRRFADVDVIAVVDAATQPMLAGPAAAVRTAAAMGHDRKLMILFTHFDEVRGANLKNLTAKQDHVMRSLDNSLSSFEAILGGTTVRGLRRNVEGRVLFLAAIDQRLDQLASAPMRRYTETELKRFVALCAEAILPLVPVEAHPRYDLGNLVLAVAAATSRFQRAWGARLGIDLRPGFRPEHWTRIKALSRRLGELNEDHYDDLQPVADFLRELTEGVSNFASTPRSWDPPNPPEEPRQLAVETVRRAMAARLDVLTTNRIWTEPLVDWRQAFHLSGTGSGRQRARDVWQIYAEAAPQLTEVPSSAGVSFMDAVRMAFKEAAKEAGGEAD